MKTLEDRDRKPIRKGTAEDITYPLDLAELRLRILLRLLEIAPVRILVVPLPLGVLLLLQHGTEVHTTGVCGEMEAGEWRTAEGGRRGREEGARD